MFFSIKELGLNDIKDLNLVSGINCSLVVSLEVCDLNKNPISGKVSINITKDVLEELGEKKFLSLIEEEAKNLLIDENIKKQMNI